jgi:4-carboxymuconolactone decarboxylase
MFEKGLEIRREMLGQEIGVKHVLEASEFTRDFQNMVTRYCFGEVWGREALPRKLRSMITVSMLLAQGRWPQVKLHLGTALKNGVTPAEIREILLNAMIYCGVPVAVEGFQCAREAFAEAGVSEKEAG